MMKNIIALSISFFYLTISLLGQDPTTEAAGLYWQTRKPYEGYWQQGVSYLIEATLDDKTDQINGTLKLTYTNNSPNDLNELYFHLYQNMFEPGSYNNQWERANSKKLKEPYQHTEISDCKVNGSAVETIKDNTIIKIPLKQPLKSGQKLDFTCSFMTQFGEDSGRMKMYESYGYKHYNVVHWYPRISVYDRKFGWTTDQHLGHEFYGDFGKYYVTLHVPEHYIMASTGLLLNRSEVYPEELMDKIDIKNFKDKPWNSKPEQVIAPSDKLKTWLYKAENVHDFAWTADPTYRIGKAIAQLESGRQIVCYAIAQEQHASGWQNAAEYTAKIVELYSKDFGEYAYHKMIVADARDGMEYPMLTLDGGRDPEYRDLLAHEVGHNWFFGMVGNNETYRASLDEGFTEFLTSWSMTKLEGEFYNLNSDEGIESRFDEEVTFRDAEVYNGYYYSAILRDDDASLNTHSDQFERGWQYGQVYSKTATLLYNLQYVLGDELFLKAMKHYFNQWKFCHPYFEDFRNSIIMYTGADLNWFFDQWLETTKKIEYAVTKVRHIKGTEYEIVLRRKGDMQMPLDVRIHDKSGKYKDYYIPNTWFEKKTAATALPKWTGWNDLNRDYHMVINSDKPVTRVEIDPSKRLADVNQINNSRPVKLKLKFDDLVADKANQVYSVEWRPSLWYNGFDGIKAGLDINGNYFKTLHKFNASVWFATGTLQQNAMLFDGTLNKDFYRLQYKLEYATRVKRLGKKVELQISSRWIDGLSFQSIGYEKRFSNNKTSFSQSIGSLWRPYTASLNYLIYPQLWQVNAWNNFVESTLEHEYWHHRRSIGVIKANLRNPFFWSDFQYGYLNLDARNDNRISKLNIRTRVFAQFGLGQNWAPESQLYAAGGNPEQMMQNSLTRSIGFAPLNTYGIGSSTGNYQFGGGLGLRGYNNYLLPEYNADNLLRYAYSGQTGAAINLEVEFDDFIRIMPQTRRYFELKTYAFSDAGIINYNRTNEVLSFSHLRMDAGLGTALDIRQWWIFNELKPTTIRVDFPIFLNRPPASQSFIQFRWLLGFKRAF